MKRRSITMTEGKLLPNMLAFYFPLVASSILQLLFNAADIIVVGKFAGDNSLAAVSSTGSLVGLLVNSFIGISTGTNVVVARYLGADEKDKVHDAVHSSVAFALLGGAVMAVFGFFGSRWMLELMDSPADVIDLSALYLKIYFLGVPFSLLYNFEAAVLRSKGDTKRPLLFLTIAGFVNVVLNLLLVIVFKMDVAGVAVATVVSQVISALLITLSLLKEEWYLKLYPRQIRLEKNSFFEIMKVGLPAGIQSALFSVSNVLIQSSVNSFGSSVMAGNGAAVNIENFTYSIMNGFYQTGQTFIGQNYGARKYDRILKTAALSLVLVIVSGILASSVVMAVPEFFLEIYTDSPAVIAAGIDRFTYVEKWYFLDGMMDVMSGVLRGMGYSMVPMIVTIFGVCVFRIIWIKTVFKAVPLISNVYITYPISWIMTFVGHVIMFLIVLPKVKKYCEEKEKTAE